MPAILDDPSAPTIFRKSGTAPFPDAATPLPASIVPKPVTLRDRTTKATLIPFGAADRVPLSLVEYLCAQMNSEIERGDTYPMIAPFSVEAFGRYWFQNFGAIMVLGNVADDGQEALWRWEKEGKGWEKLCLGSFYIKPNYPGRSSHVCNASFVVTDGARNRGVGKLMGECYLKWAPLLGYTYSVFNLVYETNVASCRIWDTLGFKRIGRVPGCGNLKTQPEGHFVDAIIYGRHLGYNKEDADDERRFERIKYYLLTGKYPGDADSAEKNRLRAAVRNYTLVEVGDDAHDNAGNKPVGSPSTGAPGISFISTDQGTSRVKLMLGDKEVISDPRQQYEIARQFHRGGGSNGSANNSSNSNNSNAGDAQHQGINRTTANVSEKYHWNRIKGTVTDVIENCAECSEKVRKKAQLKSASSSSSSAFAGPPPAPPTVHKSAAGTRTSSTGPGDDQQHLSYPSPAAAFLSRAAFHPAGPSTALDASSHSGMSVSSATYGHGAPTDPSITGFAPTPSAAINTDPALPPPLNPSISPTATTHRNHHLQEYQPVSQHQHVQQNREPPSFFFDMRGTQHQHHLAPTSDAFRPAWRLPNEASLSSMPDDVAAVEVNLARALAHHQPHHDTENNSADPDPSAMALDPSILEPGSVEPSKLTGLGRLGGGGGGCGDDGGGSGR